MPPLSIHVKNALNASNCPSLYTPRVGGIVYSFLETVVSCDIRLYRPLWENDGVVCTCKPVIRP